MLHSNIKSVRLMLQNGKITPRKLLKACLKRAKFIKQLNAFITLNENCEVMSNDNEICTASNKNSSILEKSGALAGVPIAFKDNFCTKDFMTTCASRMLSDFNPMYNATVVQKLIDGGATVVGKCNMDEFAMGSGTVESYYGATKNIWRSEITYTVDGKKSHHSPEPRIAGGSSGGSAVAVAAGACFASLGSDTGGSVRNPAAHCGIVGFKPSYSTVSRHGLIPLCNSMDVPGVLARNVPDAALVYDIINGRDPLDPTSVECEKVRLSEICPSSIKVGIPKEYYPQILSKEVHQVWTNVAALLEKLGVTVIQVSLPHTPYGISCYSILNQADVASNMARYDGLRYGLRTDESSSTEKMYAESRSQGFGLVVRSRILSGNYFLLKRNSEKYYTKGMKVRRLISEDFKKAWENVDFLLTPTTLTTASSISEFCKMDDKQRCSHEDYFTVPANLSGIPAISLPAEVSRDGLPIAIQLMAPLFSDSSLFSFAAWLEPHLAFPKLQIAES